jgi:preprotein translocase subunit YajC
MFMMMLAWVLVAQQASPWSMPLMLLGVFVIMYFFMIRPQQQQQKKERQFRDGLKEDDKVITVGGLYGRIVSLEKTSVVLDVGQSVKIRVERSAIRAYAPIETEGNKGK